MRRVAAAVALLALIAAAYGFQWEHPSEQRPAPPSAGSSSGSSSPSRSQAPTDQPGRFDFYVLSLSWSPSYCASPEGRAEKAQCDRQQPLAFVVHGLWPQNERGWPENCQQPAPWVPDATLKGMLDLMPSRGLVLHQWRKHGTCSGLDPAAYFDTVRRAWSRVTVPQEFRRVGSDRDVAPGDVERAFIAANRGLAPDMIAIDCEGRQLSEVRICLDRALNFRSCPEIEARSCRAARISVPPTLGG